MCNVCIWVAPRYGQEVFVADPDTKTSKVSQFETFSPMVAEAIRNTEKRLRTVAMQCRIFVLARLCRCFGRHFGVFVYCLHFGVSVCCASFFGVVLYCLHFGVSFFWASFWCVCVLSAFWCVVVLGVFLVCLCNVCILVCHCVGHLSWCDFVLSAFWCVVVLGVFLVCLCIVCLLLCPCGGRPFSSNLRRMFLVVLN